MITNKITDLSLHLKEQKQTQNEENTMPICSAIKSPSLYSRESTKNFQDLCFSFASLLFVIFLFTVGLLWIVNKYRSNPNDRVDKLRCGLKYNYDKPGFMEFNWSSRRSLWLVCRCVPNFLKLEPILTFY